MITSADSLARNLMRDVGFVGAHSGAVEVARFAALGPLRLAGQACEGENGLAVTSRFEELS